MEREFELSDVYDWFKFYVTLLVDWSIRFSIKVTHRDGDECQWFQNSVNGAGAEGNDIFRDGNSMT